MKDGYGYGSEGIGFAKEGIGFGKEGWDGKFIPTTLA